MPTIQSPPFVPPMPNATTHPATAVMNPAAPSTQVVAASVPPAQQGDAVQSFLSEYNVTPESLKAQIGPKVATAALFWIGGKILGFFGKK
jgi:hypothetical protein